MTSGRRSLKKDSNGKPIRELGAVYGFVGAPYVEVMGGEFRIQNVMRKVNIRDLKEEAWSSPKGKFGGFGKEVSEALGRKPASMNLMERHPFDVEICRIPPGKAPYPYHSHSAQWEFYQVIEGTGVVRHEGGRDPLAPGDAFIFGPGEAHQILNESEADLIFLVVADNPVGESAYYPDSKKWPVRSPARWAIRGEALEYYDGEE